MYIFAQIQNTPTEMFDSYGTTYTGNRAIRTLNTRLLVVNYMNWSVVLICALRFVLRMLLKCNEGEEYEDKWSGKNHFNTQNK